MFIVFPIFNFELLIFRPIQFIKSIKELDGSFHVALRSIGFNYYLCGTNLHYGCNTLVFREPLTQRNWGRCKCENKFSYSWCYRYSCFV